MFPSRTKSVISLLRFEIEESPGLMLEVQKLQDFRDGNHGNVPGQDVLGKVTKVEDPEQAREASHRLGGDGANDPVREGILLGVDAGELLDLGNHQAGESRTEFACGLDATDGGIFAGSDLTRAQALRDGLLVGHRVGVRYGTASALFVFLERAFDDGDQPACVERFGDGVDGAGLLHELAADLVALGAHQDDGQVLPLGFGSELATELIAVHARHHEVEQDQVDFLSRVQLIERILAVLGDQRFVGASLENGGHHLANGGAVVDDQDACAHETNSCGVGRLPLPYPSSAPKRYY